MNFLEGLFQTATQPKSPPHVGEVFMIWTYFAAITSVRSICLLLVNHSSDKSIRETIEHMVNEVEEPQIKSLTELMKVEGIPFPPMVPDRPLADERQVPVGAKFTDAEIMNLVVAKFEGLLTLCGTAMNQSVRDDIGLLFLRFQGQLLTQGFTVKKMMQSRGWLMVPPTYDANIPSPSATS